MGVLSADATAILVFVTDDSGDTWSGPHQIPEMATGVNFKQWMAVGPAGVLGYVWKKERIDMMPGPPESPSTGLAGAFGPQPGFDVYASVSCDGGRNWHPAVRVNAVTSPAGVSRTDALSYIALDEENAHMVWGDRRVMRNVTNEEGGTGGTHSFYGRVPFSVVTQGGPCGR